MEYRISRLWKERAVGKNLEFYISQKKKKKNTHLKLIIQRFVLTSRQMQLQNATCTINETSDTDVKLRFQRHIVRYQVNNQIK